MEIRSSLNSDLDCSAAAEVVFGDTVRLPGELMSPTPRSAAEDPTELLHCLRRLMRTISTALSSPSSPNLTSKSTWWLALTSNSDVIQAIGP
nr:unnamed protein product [Spirometra erinaceieuropaei]